MANTTTIYFTVTNNLSYDQRMQRICGSMVAAGYRVVLVGRKIRGATPPLKQTFQQKLLPSWFQKGKLFYVEYNIRLFFFLLSKKMDAVCAIDLDSILPCLYVSKLKGIKRVYDAHELFTELKEVMSRPRIHQFWMWVERKAVPQFKNGYTVNLFISQELARRYGVQYAIIRNLPLLANSIPQPNQARIVREKYRLPNGKFFLYQGAVNEGRSFETLIPAMKWVDATLVIAGDGNFMTAVQDLINLHQLQHKIYCLGAVPPKDLRHITPQAFYGLTLFENTGLNQYYSLANRFFDYIQGGIPQLCVDYPEYRAVNDKYQVAYLINDITDESLAKTLNKLVVDDVTYKTLTANAVDAAKALCWQNEEKNLITFYRTIVFNTKK